MIAALLFSCSEERPVGDVAESGNATVLFRVNTPATEAPGVGGSTRAGMADNLSQYENNINRVLVLLFRGGRLVQAMDGMGLSSTATQARFTVTTRAGGEAVKFWLLANTPLTAAEVTKNLYGKTPLEIPAALNAIAASVNTHGVTSPFPFWGEIDLPAGLATSTPDLPTQVTGVKMVRAVARALIDKTVDNATLNITSARIYRMNNGMGAVPAGVDTENKVSAPTIPTGATPLPPVSCDASSLPLGYYLAESAAAATPDAAVTAATCIVIGGKFGGSTVDTYYRIDFENNVGGVLKVGEILRNHSYRFTIQSVSAPGWSTPEEAANNRPTGLTVQVQDWADKPSVSFQNNEYTFTVSSRELPLAGAQGSESYVEFVTDAPAVGVQFKGMGVPNTSGAIENDRFRVTLTPQGAGKYRLTAVTKTENTTAAEITETITVAAGALTVDIALRQSLADYIRAATTFMWIASDGSNPMANYISTPVSGEFDITSKPDWVNITTTGNKLLVWGAENRTVGTRTSVVVVESKRRTSKIMITVKQSHWVEWTKAELIGGDHFTGTGTSAYSGITFVGRTPAGTPLGLATPAGDVYQIKWKRQGATADPANYNMLGDGYNFEQTKVACDQLVAEGKTDWRLASQDELVDLGLRIKQSANKTPYATNPDGSINYMPFTGVLSHDGESKGLLYRGIERLLGSDGTVQSLAQPFYVYENDAEFIRFTTGLWADSHFNSVRCVRDYP